MKTANRTIVSTASIALLLGASSLAMAQGQPQERPPTGAQDQSVREGYMATQTQPAAPNMWDPQRVEQSLTELGFSDIGDIRQQDGQWRFTATREFTFDPRTGQVVDRLAERAGPTATEPGAGFRATQIEPASPEMWDPEGLEQTLAQQGFSDVSEIRREGAQWRFSASRENQALDLTFDPQSGEIRDPQDQIVVTLPAPAGGYMATQMQPAPPDMWDPATVEESLRTLGYTDMGELRQQGDQFRVDARREGQTVTLIIDPRSGEIFVLQSVGSLEQPAGGGQQPR